MFFITSKRESKETLETASVIHERGAKTSRPVELCQRARNGKWFELRRKMTASCSWSPR